jgi:hypothetical protein
VWKLPRGVATRRLYEVVLIFVVSVHLLHATIQGHMRGKYRVWCHVEFAGGHRV